MAAFKHNPNYKHLAIMVVKRDMPEILDECLSEIAKKYKDTGRDFANESSYKLYKGSVLYNVLDKNGLTEKVDATCAEIMYSQAVDDEMTELFGHDHKKNAKKNVLQDKERRCQIGSSHMVSPVLRALFKMKSQGHGAVTKQIVNVLGAAELSKGVWIESYKGISRGLSSPKGGGVKRIFESGGIHEVALALQKPTMKIAKMFNFEVGREFTEKVKNLALSVVAIAALSLSMAEVAPEHHQQLIVKQQHSASLDIDSIISKVSNESLNMVAATNYQFDLSKFEKQHESSMTKIGTQKHNFEHSNDYEYEQVDSNFDNWLEEIKLDKSTHTVKDGENMWSIASQLTSEILSGFDYVLNEDCNPSEKNAIIAKVHSELIKSNNMQNPDLIFSGQKIEIPDNIVKLTTSSIDNRLDFASNCLVDVKNTHKFTL